MNDDEEADLRVDIEIKELKDLNRQYFENIIRLTKDKDNIKIICAFELCIIIILFGQYITL